MEKLINRKWTDPEYEKYVLRNEEGEPIGITGPIGPVGTTGNYPIKEIEKLDAAKRE